MVSSLIMLINDSELAINESFNLIKIIYYEDNFFFFFSVSVLMTAS
jgi:hypothetical protein